MTGTLSRDGVPLSNLVIGHLLLAALFVAIPPSESPFRFGFGSAFAFTPTSVSLSPLKQYGRWNQSPNSNRNPSEFEFSRSRIVRYDYADDGSPSDYDTSDLPPVIKEVAVDEKEEDVAIRDDLKRELLLLASVTDRGAYCSKEEKDIVIDLVAQLEALNPTKDPASNCEGDWDLGYASTQLFRSSPFFQSIRVAVGDDNKDVAENGFALHAQATSGSRVGRVRQIVTRDELISEVDLQVGMMPGIPMSVQGTVVSTAALDIVSDKRWELRILNTKVKGSNIPLFNTFMDDLQVELPVGDFYSSVRGQVPVIPMTTFYVDDTLRITRDVDENFFVFIRES